MGGERRALSGAAPKMTLIPALALVELAGAGSPFIEWTMAAKTQKSVLEAERTRTALPPMFKVLLLNDDYTPMEFVVLVLQRFFSMDREQATRIMLKVHNEGRGVCGVFPRDIAATKVELVLSFAREHQHPLACVMEES